MSSYHFQPSLIDLLPAVPEDSITSRTFYTGDQYKAILFSFAAGQELSEHTASVPAMLYFVQGEADLTLGEDKMEARAGTWAQMPAQLPHSIYARTPVLMLLLMFQAK